MVKKITLTCDRCHQPIIHSDERIAKQLAEDYPGKDICVDCDIEIQISGEVAKQSALTGQSPGEVLRSWLKKYE